MPSIIKNLQAMSSEFPQRRVPEFSVLKADNATGNFTKVVQRIAVRIAIDPNQEVLKNLRPGMSVISSVIPHLAQR